jgi:lysophospholipase L1-like esterase
MYARYVAIGDSTTEGLDDPDGAGGFRGWADRLAAQLASVTPGFRYANLAIRGRTAGDVEATQLAAAIAMRPDLATVVAGMNDLLLPRFDAARVAGHVEAMIRALAAVGATVVTFTLPDVSQRMRLGRALSGRTTALNAEIRRGARDTGAVLFDLAAYALAADPRVWAADRLHGNPEGHARLADELATLLRVPGAVSGLVPALPPMPARRRRDIAIEDATWILRFVAPWAMRRLRGVTLGDGRVAKRPILAPIDAVPPGIR